MYIAFTLYVDCDKVHYTSPFCAKLVHFDPKRAQKGNQVFRRPYIVAIAIIDCNHGVNIRSFYPLHTKHYF